MQRKKSLKLERRKERNEESRKKSEHVEIDM